MTNYRLDPAIVRADRFKRRRDGFQGKWYDTLELNMNGVYDVADIAEAVRIAYGLEHADTQGKPDGFFLVVLDPYHQHAHPVMIEV